MPVTASLFVTCLVDLFYPEVGEAVVKVLRAQGVPGFWSSPGS